MDSPVAGAAQPVAGATRSAAGTTQSSAPAHPVAGATPCVRDTAASPEEAEAEATEPVAAARLARRLARELCSELPCLRESLVAGLRERLRRGDYDPNPRDVAAGLLSLARGGRPTATQPADDSA